MSTSGVREKAAASPASDCEVKDKKESKQLRKKWFLSVAGILLLKTSNSLEADDLDGGLIYNVWFNCDTDTDTNTVADTVNDTSVGFVYANVNQTFCGNFFSVVVGQFNCAAATVLTSYRYWYWYRYRKRYKSSSEMFPGPSRHPVGPSPVKKLSAIKLFLCLIYPEGNHVVVHFISFRFHYRQTRICFHNQKKTCSIFWRSCSVWAANQAVPGSKLGGTH